MAEGSQIPGECIPSNYRLHGDQINEQLLMEEFERLKGECNEFSFLAAGKTGVGKSTLLNALTNSKEFFSSSNKLEAGTKFISKYEFERNGVTITAWDSPGFQDGSGKDEVYKKELQAKCSDVHSVLYCISLKEVRSDLEDDASALRQITHALTQGVWRKSVIVLTFANTFQKRLTLDKKGDAEALFIERIEEWRSKVYKALRECGVEESIYKELKVVPAGHVNKPHLFGQKFWLSNLWIKIYVAVQNEEARIALHKANEDRIVVSKEGQKISPYSIVLSKEDVITVAAGGTVGVAGAAVGGTTGALIGALAIGIPTFGIGAGVGLVLGLVVGGAVGGGVGTGFAALVRKIRQMRRRKEAYKVN